MVSVVRIDTWGVCKSANQISQSERPRLRTNIALAPNEWPIPTSLRLEKSILAPSLVPAVRKLWTAWAYFWHVTDTNIRSISTLTKQKGSTYRLLHARPGVGRVRCTRQLRRGSGSQVPMLRVVLHLSQVGALVRRLDRALAPMFLCESSSNGARSRWAHPDRLD